ncbi:MAG: peptidylprolyl isomerase [Elusimicrobia bacterium]|nr:peptidylprolyl isomerase [Elusimicrobiota bacterium]MDE2236368.1 peptidylprolyl isomerase [Elusimicrobiota bacterium]MDE2426164.1 peptidylprolyl isomerase [Elusimicrobiota bacterium]
MRRWLIVVAAGLALAGCRRREPVIAKVGSLAITSSEFEHKLEEVAPGYQDYVGTSSGRRQFLDILIREKLILAAAEASDVKRSAQFRSKVEQMRRESQLRLREDRDYLLTRMWIDELRSKGMLSVSEQEALDYWRKHPTEVSARNILVATPQLAQEIAKKARAGADFARLARKYSLDAKTAAAGGRMTTTLYGEIIPDLADTIFRMRVGEVAGPIKSKFGYHIIKKDGERRVAFKRVRERILRLLEDEKLDGYLQSLQNRFPVEVVDERFK